MTATTINTGALIVGFISRVAILRKEVLSLAANTARNPKATNNLVDGFNHLGHAITHLEWALEEEAKHDKTN